jgi:hypothetical protein
MQMPCNEVSTSSAGRRQQDRDVSAGGAALFACVAILAAGCTNASEPHAASGHQGAGAYGASSPSGDPTV